MSCNAVPRARRPGRVSPARRRPTSGTRPTRRWRRPCAARARDPRRSVLVRRRDRRTPGSAPARIGQSAARHRGRAAGEPDQASAARLGAGNTRGTGSRETGGGLDGSQPSGDRLSVVTVIQAVSWRSLVQPHCPDWSAQSPELKRLRQHVVPRALVVVDDQNAPGTETLARQETHRASPRSSLRGCIEGARPMGLRQCELRPALLDARPLADSEVCRNYTRQQGARREPAPEAMPGLAARECREG